jgi:hypothetical protein
MIDDRNEQAWHIIDFGLMHDPDLADLVEVPPRGTASIPSGFVRWWGIGTK